MTMTNTRLMQLLNFLVLLAFMSSLFAQRGLPPQTTARTYAEVQEAHVSVLRQRISEGNPRFLVESDLKIAAQKSSVASSGKLSSQMSVPASINTLELQSDVLVSFPVRLTAPKVTQYLKRLGASVVALHRSVGDDQLSIGVGADFDTPVSSAQLRQDFLDYLSEREAKMQSEIRRTDPGSFGRLRAEANLRAVVSARTAANSVELSFDGVLVRVPDSKLAEVTQLPDGMTALLAEIQLGSRRSFAIPLDVLRTSKNRDKES